MKALEFKYKERTFLIPAVPFTSVLIYQRYGDYYTDLQGWEVTSEQTMNQIEKQNFYLNIEEGTLEFKITNIKPSIAVKLIDNEVKSSGSFPLTDQDYKQMLDKFYTLDKFLKKEGLID